jgi:hypothetical protein
MFASCCCGSGRLDVPVGQTSLLYKEAPELLHQSWQQQQADSSELFCVGPGAAARNLAAGECGASW